MEKTGHIKFSFLATTIAFTFPIAFLIYFMIQFKNESIDFGISERNGTLQLKKLIEDIRQQPRSTLQFQQIIEDVSVIGDQSKLILDPDLDSYYLMDIVVNILPKSIGHLQQVGDPEATLEATQWILPLIREDLREFERALRIAQREDPNFHGSMIEILPENIGPLHKNFELVVGAALKNAGEPSAKREVSLNGMYDLWFYANAALEKMLVDRIQHLKYERNIAIIITVGLWICSLIFVIFFSQSIARRQTELYQEIENQNLKLTASSKMSALGEMAGGIAHEINTPLAAIRLNSETMLEGLINDLLEKDDLVRVANNLIKIVDRISAIVISMRKLTRDASFDPRTEANLSEILVETVTLCSESIRRKGVSLSIDVPKDIRLHCNIVELSQVFINLIGNAIDATSAQTAKWIRIKAILEGDFVTIKVADSGPPIPVEVRKKMFAPFFTTKPIGSGTGLGLGISKRIIEEHLGTLIFEDRAETCFVIRLPLRHLEAEAKHDDKKTA